MNFTTKRINTANAMISGNITLETLEDKFESVVKKIAKNAKIDGFRPGKVPTQVIKTRYKQQAEQDAQQEVIQDLLQSALKELGIAPNELIGNPMISKFDKLDKHIDIEVKVSIAPPINIDNIESYVPEVKLVEIANAQIDKRLEEIAQSRAVLSEITEDRALQKDDTANIDFQGFLDGKVFDGGKGENFNLMIGSNQFIPGFEDSLIGMKKGEKKTIKVTFPKDYQATHLAGREATFDVNLNKILKKDIPQIDDSFAQSVAGEEATLETLKDMIKEQLQVEQKNELYNKELKEKLIDSLLQNVSFDLPELIIEQEMDILFRNALSKLPPEEFQKLKESQEEAKKQRELQREEAQKSVQITFIADALAKKYNISINDNEVLQTIYYEAMMTGQDPRSTLEHYQKNNLIPVVKMAMIEDKVFQYLLDQKLESSKNVQNKAKSKTKEA